MLITAVILVVVCAGLMIVSGLQSSGLAANAWLRRLVVLGSLLAAVLGGALIFESLAPAAPSVEGTLVTKGDAVALGDVTGGVLSIECTMLEGVNKTGLGLTARLDVAGEAGKESHKLPFQLGDSPEGGDNPKVSNMATSIPLTGLGANTQVTLAMISTDGLVSLNAAYRPNRFPVYPALMALFVLVGLAAVFEGAAPSGWRRTFLTVTVSGVAALAWFLENGLTTDDSGWTLWIRIAYAIVIGAVVGTLLPLILGKFLPEFKAPTRPDAASEEKPDNTPEEMA